MLVHLPSPPCPCALQMVTIFASSHSHPLCVLPEIEANLLVSTGLFQLHLAEVPRIPTENAGCQAEWTACLCHVVWPRAPSWLSRPLVMVGLTGCRRATNQPMILPPHLMAHQIKSHAALLPAPPLTFLSSMTNIAVYFIIPQEKQIRAELSRSENHEKAHHWESIPSNKSSKPERSTLSTICSTSGLQNIK